MNKADPDKQKQFLTLYEAVSGRLSRFILSLVWNKEDARDIASETVLIAFQKFDKIQSEQVFIYYLFSIASRLIKQFNRKKKLWGIFSRETASRGEETTIISESGLDMDVLHRAMNRLSAKEKEAIMLFEIAGLSLAEIQEIQKDSLSAVKSRLSRGRAKLSKMILEKSHEKPMHQPGTAPEKLFMIPAVQEPFKNGQL